MSLYIVSYDIEENRIRNKISKVLEGYGRRVQYSVFECELKENQFAELYRKLAALSGDFRTDSIRFYKICANCEKNILVIGTEKRNIKESNEQIIVL